jgi:predicted MFS family arabinose efflux permease
VHLTLALAVVAFVIGVDNYIVAAILPDIAADLDEPIAAVGLLASAYALPTALLAPVFGPLSDRRGRRFSMLLGLTLFTIAAAACVVAPSLPLLIGARVANGLGAAIAIPAVFALAGDLPTLGERARTMSVVAGMFPLASLLGLPIGALAAIAGGWRMSFLFIVIVGLVAIVLVYRFSPRIQARPSVGSYLGAYRVIFQHPRVLRVIAVILVWWMGTFGLFIYVGEFVHQSFGVPTDQAGLIYIAVGVSGLIATRVSGHLITTVGPRRVVLFALAGFAISAFLLPRTAIALPLTVLVFLFWAFSTWAGVPALQTIVAGLSADARGTMLALNTSAQNLGAVIGPIVTGQLIVLGGFALAGPYTALVGLTALAIAYVVLPRGASSPAAVVAAEG